MTYRVRAIRDGDWDGIVALEAEAYRERGLSEGRAALESRGRASPATSFVLDTGERLSGYLLALPYPRFAYPDLQRPERAVIIASNLHLHDLVIAAGLRGNGLAKLLLRHLTDAASARAYRWISLIAVGGSETFWSAGGYRAHPEVALPTGYGANAVYMSRAIPRHDDEKG